MQQFIINFKNTIFSGISYGIGKANDATRMNLPILLAAAVLITGVTLGFKFGGAEIGFIVMGSVFSLIGLIVAMIAIFILPAASASGSSVGVLSFMVRTGETLTSVFLGFVHNISFLVRSIVNRPI